MLKDKQKSAKTLPQRLAGLNKERGAWGENLACGVAWQSVLLERSGAWQGTLNSAKRNTAQRGEFGNEMAKHSKIQRHGNKNQHNEVSVASTANSTHSTTNSTKYSEFDNANSAKRCFASETMHDTASTANSVWRVFADKTAHGKFGLASVAKMVFAGKTKLATLQIQHGDNGAVLAPYAWSKNLACGVAWQNVVNSATHNTANLAWQVLVGKAKMGQCLGGGLLSLSLSLPRRSHLWHAFGLN